MSCQRAMRRRKERRRGARATRVRRKIYYNSCVKLTRFESACGDSKDCGNAGGEDGRVKTRTLAKDARTRHPFLLSFNLELSSIFFATRPYFLAYNGNSHARRRSRHPIHTGHVRPRAAGHNEDLYSRVNSDAKANTHSDSSSGALRCGHCITRKYSYPAR